MLNEVMVVCFHNNKNYGQHHRSKDQMLLCLMSPASRPKRGLFYWVKAVFILTGVQSVRNKSTSIKNQALCTVCMRSFKLKHFQKWDQQCAALPKECQKFAVWKGLDKTTDQNKPAQMGPLWSYLVQSLKSSLQASCCSFSVHWAIMASSTSGTWSSDCTPEEKRKP